MNSKLKPFYGLEPKIENFSKQIELKEFSFENRKTLFAAVKKQYANFSVCSEVSKNLDYLLDNNTYTVTTGHQLTIFGGPLYFIYKIITTINTAKVLTEKYPDCRFVPVFWMASEDHDKEEIDHFNLFGKQWKWETNQEGAVGRFETKGLDELLDKLPEKISLFEIAYKNHKTLSEATRYFVNELFGNKGLIIIDGDDRELKRQFSTIMEDELLNNTSFKIVTKTSDSLLKHGYEAQVHAREINLFYLDENCRERIIFEKGKYKVNHTTIEFSYEEIIQLVRNEPEKFSPNVLLRPLYQESILPNLAYIGGPAEVIYWLQLKEVFECYQISFPVIMPRDFALYLTSGNVAKLNKLSISNEELFLPSDVLKNNYLLKIAGEDFKLSNEKESLKNIFNQIKNKAILIDKTMESVVMAELQKLLKQIDELEKKLRKAEERKNESSISQLLHLKDKLFPNGELQERYDNFLNFYIGNTRFIKLVENSFDPFDYSFNIISEDE